MKNYTFVDYATQAYIALVGLLILFFHNGTVSSWPLRFGAHAAALVVVHGLIQLHARYKAVKLLDFLRHFYPVLLYTAFFIETGSLNRMFFRDYLDPVVAQWEQDLFGCQPSVLFMQKLPWLWVSELFYASYFSYYVMSAGWGVPCSCGAVSSSSTMCRWYPSCSMSATPQRPGPPLGGRTPQRTWKSGVSPCR